MLPKRNRIKRRKLKVSSEIKEVFVIKRQKQRSSEIKIFENENKTPMRNINDLINETGISD